MLQRTYTQKENEIDRVRERVSVGVESKVRHSVNNTCSVMKFQRERESISTSVNI